MIQTKIRCRIKFLNIDVSICVYAFTYISESGHVIVDTDDLKMRLGAKGVKIIEPRPGGIGLVNENGSIYILGNNLNCEIIKTHAEISLEYFIGVIDKNGISVYQNDVVLISDKDGDEFEGRVEYEPCSFNIIHPDAGIKLSISTLTNNNQHEFERLTDDM